MQQLRSFGWLIALGGLLLLLSPQATSAQRGNQPNNYCPGHRGPGIRVFAQLQGALGWSEPVGGGFMGGLGAGAQIGGFTYAGLYMQALMAEVVHDGFAYEGTRIEPRLSLQEGGAWVRYSPIGFSWMRLLIGSRVGLTHAVWNDPDADKKLEATGFQATPLAGLEVPLQRYARLEFGGGYRFSELNELPRNLGQFNGPMAYVLVRFGNF